MIKLVFDFLSLFDGTWAYMLMSVRTVIQKRGLHSVSILLKDYVVVGSDYRLKQKRFFFINLKKPIKCNHVK